MENGAHFGQAGSYITEAMVGEWNVGTFWRIGMSYERKFFPTYVGVIHDEKKASNQTDEAFCRKCYLEWW